MDDAERSAKAQRRAAIAFCVASITGGVAFVVAVDAGLRAYMRLMDFLDKS